MLSVRLHISILAYQTSVVREPFQLTSAGGGFCQMCQGTSLGRQGQLGVSPNSLSMSSMSQLLRHSFCNFNGLVTLALACPGPCSGTSTHSHLTITALTSFHGLSDECISSLFAAKPKKLSSLVPGVAVLITKGTVYLAILTGFP